MRLALTNSINRYAGGAWTPARLSGLIGWYRNQKPDNTDIFTASDTLASNGDNVHKWLDSSGNNSHITASSNFYQYNLESGGVISAEDSNDTLSRPQMNFSGEFAMYIRVSFDSFTSGAHDLFFYDTDTSSEDFFRVQSGSEIRGKINNSQKIGFTTSISENTFVNIGIERDDTNRVVAYLNGSAQTQISTSGYATGAVSGTLDIDSIGGNTDGKIKEIVIVNTSLSASDRTKLNNYLTAI